MFAIFLLALALQQQSAPPATGDVAPEDVIVVTAKKHKCRLSIASRVISDSEFQKRAAEWAAGRPVRVMVPAGTDYQCLAKIMFRLNDHGVKRAAFVDAPAE
ncbi:hypothetical protein [Sphingomonas sp.]|uniref:ExbD/TolR family protein n=1 Tax=Sphingomonas sp. TaxID=28214 RepID=UPI001B146F1E|nr:hypothetical protein [Sphingomonas sp.]MBO9714928.1 hypothetical protein [Sphingomonas sp.]